MCWYLILPSTDLAWVQNHEFIRYDLFNEDIRNDNQTCFIPKIHPFHPSIVQYLKKMDPMKCRNIQMPLMYIDDNGLLKINRTALKSSFWSEKSISCQFSEIMRDNSTAEDTFVFNTSKIFEDPTDVSHADFISVQCKNSLGLNVYNNILAHIRDSSFDHKFKIENGTSEKYNVLMFGIDSVSRLNALRQLPKTYKILTEVLNSSVLKGYMKVGANTFPNLATMLTGFQPWQRPNSLFPNEKENKPHDPWPFIWKNFSENGYRTMFSEDLPTYNAFHYMSGGFDAQPTDHYARTLWKAVESTSLLKFSSFMCYGSQPKHLIHMDYLKRLVTRLHGKIPYWGFSFLTEICHDYLNTIGMADDDIYNFVKDLYDKKYFDDTIFIFFSDHGQRIDRIRETYVGSVEDKMPMMSIRVPDRFKRSQPIAIKNLKQNEFRLTSPFDIYCTLVDILKLSANSSHKVGRFKTLHGFSLFGEVPSNRTCPEAGVESGYCLCKPERNIPVQESVVKSAANHLVSDINQMLLSKYNNFDSCAELFLKTIRYARLVGEEEEDKKTILVVIETSPSGGVFEGTVEVSGPNDDVVISKGDIERINRYGDQSNCITDRVLQMFCYCH